MLEVPKAIDTLSNITWDSRVFRPDFINGFDIYTKETQGYLRALGDLNIDLQDRGDRNTVLTEKGFTKLGARLRVAFNGSDNILLIGAKSGLRGEIAFGSNSVAVICGHQHVASFSVTMFSGSTLLWGQGSRTYGCRMWLDGGKRIVIGDDCLLSEAVQIHTSDHHSLIDLDTYEQINAPADVSFGRHVWIGPNVSILKGVEIGKGAVIAAGAMVSRSVPEAELWGGVPAHMIKQRISWVDSHPANPAQIARLRELIGEPEGVPGPDSREVLR